MTTDQDVPTWQRLALLVAALQCGIWGAFILALPEKSALAYGFSKVPTDLFLWRGMGLIILLFGLGYGIAATNPNQHWVVILIGLIAKVLGPIGMLWSVLKDEVAIAVLYLIPFNDLIWWVPFTIILAGVFRSRSVANSSTPDRVAITRP